MRKIALILVLTAILAVGLSTVALAYTPEDIYNDYKDNGQLDNTYTDAELQAYLDDALSNQYNYDSELYNLVQRMLGTEGSEFPFTGAQLTLMIVGAAALVGVGVGIRRLARTKA